MLGMKRRLAFQRDEAGVSDANHGYAIYWRILMRREASESTRLGRPSSMISVIGACMTLYWRRGVV